VAALAVVALTLTAASCGPSTDGVATGEVGRATVTELVDVPASVTAKAVATLTSPADGTLASLAVRPGDTVAKDQVLAVVDSPTAQKRLADAQAGLAAANQVGGGIGYVNLSTASSGVDQAAQDAFGAARTAADKLSDPDLKAALLAQVDAAEQHYRAAAETARQLQRQVQQGIAGIGEAVSALGAAQQVQAQSAVDLAQSTVDALTIRAPIAGVVQLARPATAATNDPLSTLLGQVTGGQAPSTQSSGQTVGVDDILAPGDRVGAGTAVVTIVDISEIGLVGEVDETDVLLVAPGVLADVELDAAPGLTFEALVGTVDLLPTPSTRGGVAYRIRMSFRAVNAGDRDEPVPTPRPGMSAVAHLKVRTAVDAVAVPAAAVFTVDGGEAVWLVRDGSAVRQTVRVGVQGFGRTGEDLVQILEGLKPGDRVVTSGADKVSPGQDLP
jgi:multidrug efflux pump subunit AcrA (membrane-fusion protein)